MQELGAVIAARLAEWEVDDLPLEREVFGTADPDALAHAVDRWCRAQLGAPIERYLFFAASSGSVHGVRLADGREVVVKGHRPAVTRDYLDAVVAVQDALATQDFPAPSPLAGPVPVGGGHVTAERLIAAPPCPDPHAPEVRRALADGLATFIELARDHASTLAAVTHPMSVQPGELYPTPHSPRFDFVKTAAGAGWIDELAAQARVRLDGRDDRPHLVHGDWRIENVRVHGGGIVAVYDWDSVQLAPETTAVAIGATTFSVDWTQPSGRRFPLPAEIGAFVEGYERARGAPFIADEREALAATMTASLAYGARCEHADPGRPPAGDDSQRALLARLGTSLLHDGLSALGR